jgi:hypothetical protein
MRFVTSNSDGRFAWRLHSTLTEVGMDAVPQGSARGDVRARRDEILLGFRQCTERCPWFAKGLVEGGFASVRSSSGREF